MSDKYFDGSVETQYLDPVSYVPNGRCAFELDGDKMAYLSNMRLLDIGVVAGVQTNYSKGLGAMALIKNIRLMDARTELSALRNPAQYLFFKNANRSNAINKSNDSYLKRNALGLEIQATDGKLAHIYASGPADTTEQTTNKGYLDLREVFPILNVLRVLPTQIFRNLRIEVEFDANILNQILVDNSIAITTLRPVLAVDHINNAVLVNQEINSLMKSGVIWDEILHDNWTIPAVDTTAYAPADVATQNASNQSLAYKGKIVERLLICKQLQNRALSIGGGNAVLGFGGVASSYAVLNQTTQYRVNGRNIIPGFNGVNRPNERLGMLSDEWGSVNGFIGSNLYKWSNRADSLADPNEAGQMSWDCVRLGQRVADLQVQIQRTNQRDADALAPTNEALTINAYGECKKAMAIMASGYNIVFA
tara:strand:+ start:951 stop:2213 length:1263 start_codon:yes stop_codon:yes gene_type:complete